MDENNYLINLLEIRIEVKYNFCSNSKIKRVSSKGVFSLTHQHTYNFIDLSKCKKI